MAAHFKKLALIRPGMPAADLQHAMGSDWQAPGRESEGHIYAKRFSARLTADGRVGEIHFHTAFPVPVAVDAIQVGMPLERFQALYPGSTLTEESEYGWQFFTTPLPQGWLATVAAKDGAIGNIGLALPGAVYPERPYKYADGTLTQAFDLQLCDPVPLAPRPPDGWCFGLPPGIGAERWPISPRYGTPLRHAFTLRLPEAYRTRGGHYVAIALFADDQVEELTPVEGLDAWCEQLAHPGTRAAAEADPRFGRFAPRFLHDDLARCDLRHWSGTFVLVWLTQHEWSAPLGTPPDMEALPGHAVPGWLTQTPAAYHGDSLPRTAAEQQEAKRLLALMAQGGFDPLQHPPFAAPSGPGTGWKHLPGQEALQWGWPIRISERTNDPNTGKPAREWEHENQHSGYVPAYSDAGRALGLPALDTAPAHLGGTMFPAQGYPDFSPFYLEFQETFGGFNFGTGVAQIDLQEMQIDWAC